MAGQCPWRGVFYGDWRMNLEISRVRILPCIFCLLIVYITATAGGFGACTCILHHSQNFTVQIRNCFGRARSRDGGVIVCPALTSRVLGSRQRLILEMIFTSLEGKEPRCVHLGDNLS
jgi:hypothetical protein